jgi:hypothetical protein
MFKSIRKRSLFVAVLLGGALLTGPTALAVPPAETLVPTPTLTPIEADAGNGHALSGMEGIVDLAELGYQEHEYLMSGAASTYDQAGTWTSDGKWNTTIASTGNPYTTRMLVLRPTDPAKFNGTVVVEWLNVSFGVDIPVEFSQSYEHFTRAGYIYVGLTTQKVGTDALSRLDPARYPGVGISDDALSYDIFSQAAQAVRTNPEVTGGTAPTTVLGAGHSQSALRMVTYANAIQPTDAGYDGLLVHGRAAAAAPINSDASSPRRPLIRTDLTIPVFTLQAETDVITSSSVRQDTAMVRTWEVAGSAHADQYGLDMYNAANARDKAINDGAPTTCDNPVNAMTFRYASNVAYAHLDRWARGGGAPPTATPIETLGLIIIRDQDGNARGGVRLPDLDAPVATYAPTNSGGNVTGACLLLGKTTPFTPARIGRLYPDHDSYVAAFVAAADRAKQGGYLLPADYDEAVTRANEAPVP